MIDQAIHHPVRCPPFIVLLLCHVSLFCAVGITVAAVVGDQIELNATHQAGIPFHQEPRGTNDFQRVPDGTKATVLEVAPDGRWLKLSLPDGRTGWVTSRYVGFWALVVRCETGRSGHWHVSAEPREGPWPCGVAGVGNHLRRGGGRSRA